MIIIEIIGKDLVDEKSTIGYVNELLEKIKNEKGIEIKYKIKWEY